MTKKEFTDALFKAMYETGYRKAEVAKGHLFFYKTDTFMDLWTPRIPVELTCFVDKTQCINIAEYLCVTDWEKVEVDTPIFVKMKNDKLWKCRYFSKYENGKVYAWVNGKTSWSNCVSDVPSSWECAKLAGDRE